jgi:hypothetical protein
MVVRKRETHRLRLTDVLALELAGQVALHERGLASAAVSDKHKLEAWALIEVESFSGRNREIHLQASETRRCLQEETCGAQD